MEVIAEFNNCFLGRLYLECVVAGKSRIKFTPPAGNFNAIVDDKTPRNISIQFLHNYNQYFSFQHFSFLEVKYHFH